MPVVETLGGALFGAVLQVLFDRLDSHQVLDYFRGRSLNDKLLKKLKRKLVSINAVVDDAELKQFSNSYVKAWLDEVRDVLLDAEDLLDEIDYEFTKCELEGESQTSSKVCNFESRMIEVLDDLESLSNQKDDLGLKNASGVGIGSGSGSQMLEKLPSTSLVTESVVYGRDYDKEMILNWVVSDSDNHNQLSILSIVGMGGVGKTTLAQHVYNDPRMEMKEANFGIKAWICVSDEFDVFKVTRTILEAIINSTDDSRNLEMVQGRLKEKLLGKRFLLVLDDVWNEDRDQWKALQTPLKYGAKGSKILVTTRSNKVASTMLSNEVHQLKQLKEEHSWQVFTRHAFQDNNPQLNVEMKEIGMKIVEKCKGLPLALETIGCLLHTKSSISEWESVLISKIWDLRKEDSKIISALLLSYYYLPSHLKRCFAYCALFPKDHKFNKESLILLWMAENFLQCPQSKSPEEVGEQYFEDLISRSFFQPISTDKNCFVMHDLINDLAKYVCRDICFRFGVDKPKGIPKIRHFSFVIGENQYCDEFGSLCLAKRLRTFMFTNRKRIFREGWDRKMLIIHELFSKFKFLRVLSLSHCCEIEEVPDSVGDLKHLRSLDLSSTNIRKLPDSTCFLYNLQILKLNSCHKLEELPLNLHKLTNLHRLELIYTDVRKMPMHLEKLKNLQVLMSFFYVGKSSEFNIQQLGELNLRGQLVIMDLQNIVNPIDALAANLKNKTHLVQLSIQWNWNHSLEDSMKEREVLENLQPSRHLEKLTIRYYGGTQFPSWFSSSNVMSLRLEDCKYCVCLPPLGLLPFLKDLTIRGLDGIVGIDADFYGSSSSSFTSLETLDFQNMNELEEWECNGVTGAFPRLQRLSIVECPKLKGHLPEQLFHLKNLHISGCKQLVAPMSEFYVRGEGVLEIHYHPTTLKSLTARGHVMEASLLERIGHIIISDTSLRSLHIESCKYMNIPMNRCFDFLVQLEINSSCDSLTTFPLDFFPKLSHLALKCHNLQMISQGQTHNHLKHLKIGFCPLFESFPSEGLSAPCLESFKILTLEKLKSLPKHMHILLPCLTSLLIYSCPQLDSFSDGALPSNLKEMSLFNCSKLFASLKQALGVNPSLETLSIGNLDVEFFPDDGLLPLSLTSLTISFCPKLKKLDHKDLCQLSSLEKLILQYCHSLQCLPDEGLPKSITTLKILHCSLLKQRCQKSGGEEWKKIAHIKNILVDDEQIKE